jgi:hypothetical protein
VVYLHGGKPYLRGGDFDSLRTSGERPMQLNYSRAFGGRKLKPYGYRACVPVSVSFLHQPLWSCRFGLTAEPTVMQTALTMDDWCGCIVNLLPVFVRVLHTVVLCGVSV